MEKVLIIEDDDLARKNLHRVVQKEGFEVNDASNGKDALELFHKIKPDIIITDIKMPGMDGLEILYKVKEISPGTEVIVITGHGDYDTALIAINHGAIDYIKKPVNIDDIMIALGRCQEKITKRKNLKIVPNILLAEDDDVAREKLVKELNKENWNIIAASDGEEALEAFYKNKIDIIISDIKMPKRDGVSLLREIKKHGSDCEIIMLTGYGDEEVVIDALRFGAINFIKKPIDIDQLVIFVEKALEKLSLSRALLYRNRDLELAMGIIFKITKNKEIIIDMRDEYQKSLWDFVLSMLDELELSLCILDKDLNIILSNQRLDYIIKGCQRQINDEFLEKVKSIGIIDITLKQIKEKFALIMEAENGFIDTIKTGKYSRIILSKINIHRHQKLEEAIFLSFRGERN